MKRIFISLKQKWQTLINDWERGPESFRLSLANSYRAQGETLMQNWKSVEKTNTENYGKSLLNTYKNVWNTQE